MALRRRGCKLVAFFPTEFTVPLCADVARKCEPCVYSIVNKQRLGAICIYNPARRAHSPVTETLLMYEETSNQIKALVSVKK